MINTLYLHHKNPKKNYIKNIFVVEKIIVLSCKVLFHVGNLGKLIQKRTVRVDILSWIGSQPHTEAAKLCFGNRSRIA